MAVKYKIGIWGQFGDGGPIADGQAVRTTIITNELIARYGKQNLYIVNTNGWKRKPFRFLYCTIKLLRQCQKVVIFPADNGFKIVVPLLSFFNKFHNRELYDVVIGGYLPDLLRYKPHYLKMLKKYDALFVQTLNLKKDLEDIGLNNIFILSNLKRLNTLQLCDIKINNDPYIRVCTMSRINDSKGIKDAFTAVKLANEVLGSVYIHLDVFGMVAPEYKEQFKRLLSDNSDFASYGGVIKYDKTVETLKDYFVMLFPTYYYGEGFPGNVVDAYNSGLPMIATDWKYNKEVIKDERNGILVKPHSTKQLSDALLMLYRNREFAYKIATNNIEDSNYYKPNIVLKEFYELIEKKYHSI